MPEETTPTAPAGGDERPRQFICRLCNEVFDEQQAFNLHECSALNIDEEPALPPKPKAGRSGFGWIATHNPFYLLSAMFVLIGVHASLDAADNLWMNTLIPLGILVVYAGLLAVTAVFIVRKGSVWDDARTLIISLVLVCGAASVSLDELLTRDTLYGFTIAGSAILVLLFICEFMRRGLRVIVGRNILLPFYGLLVFLFVYPALPGWLVVREMTMAMKWSLVAFPALAALLLLTLIPAIRARRMNADNGTPWPQLPVVAFVILTVCVAVRSYLLSVSFYPGAGVGGYLSLETVFGTYFLVPLVLAAAILLLEAGICRGSKPLQYTALLCLSAALPMSLPGSGGAGYQDVLTQYTMTLGSPVLLTTWLVIVICAVAWYRGVRPASGLGLAALFLATMIDGGTMSLGDLGGPQPVQLLLLAVVYAIVPWRMKRSLVWLISASVAAYAVGDLIWHSGNRTFAWLAAAHVWLAAAMVIGALYRDRLADWLEIAAAALIPAFGCAAAAYAALAAAATYQVALLAVVLWMLLVMKRGTYWMAAGVLLLVLVGEAGVQLYRAFRSLQLAGAGWWFWGGVCMAVGFIISCVKGGIIRPRFMRHDGGGAE